MQQEAKVRRYEKILANWSQPLGFELIPAVVDEYGQALFGQWGGWWLGINEMLVNERLVMWRQSDGGTEAPNVPVFGWCYPKGGLALMALMSFKPETMGEPLSFVKRAMGERLPGETADVYARSLWE